jgi:ribonucleoside-diphosphate reductase alpha chain
MTGRRRLADRRRSLTFDIEVAGLRYKATISFFPDGSLGELFVSNHKAGNASDVAARDAGILVSLCLQHGCPVETIAHAISRNSDGSASGVIGAVLDKVITQGGRS